jgi:hypothetical protein
MTIATEQVKVQYQGNGTTTVFAIPYPLVTPQNLSVTLYDSVNFGNVTPNPILNGDGTYDFTFSGELDPAGKQEYIADNQITFNTAPPSNYRITILRGEPYLQDLALNNTLFNPPSLEGPGFDNCIFQTEQLAAGLGTCLQAPASDTTPMAPLLPQELRAGTILGFDQNGNPVGINPTGEIVVGSTVPVIVMGGTSVAAQAGNVYLCDCTAGAITINLPSACDGTITIKDATGQASAAKPITVAAPAGTIEGNATLALTFAYQWVTLMGYPPAPAWVQI